MIKDLFGIVVIVNVNDKSCNIGEYLDYSNCTCKKKLFDKLVEEYTESINETSLVKKT